jgi:hypothetical protein
VLVFDGGDDGAPLALVERRMSTYARLQKPSVELLLCTGEQATRAAVVAAATDAVGLIIGFGHGDPTEFFGVAGDDPVLRAGTPAAHVVANKIVHLTGCEAAAELGPRLVKEHGALAFFGYAERFTYPVEGDAAVAAYECMALLNGALAAGYNAAAAHAYITNGFIDAINRFQGDPFTAAIFSNMLESFRSPSVDPIYGVDLACLRP